MVKEVRWRVYIVRCADDTLYTGISIDVDRRCHAHNAGRGAKYTRSRRPVKVVYVSLPMTKSGALREENRIKSLTRTAKLMIIKENS